MYNLWCWALIEWDAMKKLLKILAWLAGVVIVLAILAFVGLKIFLPAEKIRDLAIEKGSAAIGREVSVETIDISIWGGLGVKLEKVAVGNPEGIDAPDFLAAENVDVKLHIWPLLSGEYQVDRLIVNRPRINMVKLADGVNNYTFETVDRKIPDDVARDMSPETKTAAAAVSFDRLEVNDGRVSYRDDSSGTDLQLIGLNLSTALDRPDGRLYRSSGKISVDTVRAAFEEPLPPLSIALRYEAEYDLPRQRLNLQQADLDVNGLEFRIEGELQHPEQGMTARATIKSRRIKVADLFKLMSPEQLAMLEGFDVDGGFTLDADVQYDANRESPLLYSGSAVINDLVMAKDDIPGKLRFQKALLDFEPDNLRMNIENGTFDDKPLKGHVVVSNFESPRINGELAGQANLAFATPFLPAEDAHELAGAVDFSIKFQGPVEDFEAMVLSGQLAVADGRYNSALLPEPIDEFTCDVYFDNTLTRVNDLSLKTASGWLDFKGRINNLLPYMLADSAGARAVSPAIDGQLKGRVNLALANRFLDPTGSPELAGQLDMDINLAGDATDFSNFQPRGNVSIRNASYRDSLLPEPIEALSADLNITPDTITVRNIAVEFTSSDLTLSGKLINPFPYLLPLDVIDRSQVKRPLFLFEVSSRRFDTDRLFPEAVPGSGTNRSALPADSVPPIILPDIDGAGTFTIDTMIYSGVEFTAISGKVRIANRQIDCYDVDARVYSGEVSGNTSVDLNDFENPRYVGEFHARRVEADDFASRFSKMGGHVFGKINLDGTYDAVGWEPEDFLESLSMNGDLNMDHGTVRTSGSVYSGISGLASKLGESFDQEQALKDLKTHIKVADGRVALDELTTSLGNLGDIGISGFYGFDGSLEYKGTILLSESWTQKLLSKSGLVGGLMGLISDRSIDRVRLPLAITGTVDKPELSVDYSAMGDAMGDNLKDDAKDLLQGLFKKK